MYRCVYATLVRMMTKKLKIPDLSAGVWPEFIMVNLVRLVWYLDARIWHSSAPRWAIGMAGSSICVSPNLVDQLQDGWSWHLYI